MILFFLASPVLSGKLLYHPCSILFLEINRPQCIPLRQKEKKKPSAISPSSSHSFLLQPNSNQMKSVLIVFIFSGSIYTSVLNHSDFYLPIRWIYFGKWVDWSIIYNGDTPVIRIMVFIDLYNIDNIYPFILGLDFLKSFKFILGDKMNSLWSKNIGCCILQPVSFHRTKSQGYPGMV